MLKSYSKDLFTQAYASVKFTIFNLACTKYITPLTCRARTDCFLFLLCNFFSIHVIYLADKLKCQDVDSGNETYFYTEWQLLYRDTLICSYK